MDSHDPERLSSVCKRMSGVRELYPILYLGILTNRHDHRVDIYSIKTMIYSGSKNI